MRWVGVLEKLSNAINNSTNRSIGVAPNMVTFENRKKIFKKLYGSRSPPVECKFTIGDVVRLPLNKALFDKGYALNWTKELYKIVTKQNDGSVCFYKVESMSGEKLDKNYYEQELNLTIKNEVFAAK